MAETGGDRTGPPPAPRELPTPEQLRWVLVLYGTAVFVPACLVLALVTGGRTTGGGHVGQLFVDYLAAPFPIPIAIGYGTGYLIVQYRIRNRKPSFLQSQLFAGCVFLGMFAGFAICSLAISHSALNSASRAAVTALVVPVKLAVGGVVGAYLYPFMARKRVNSRYISPTPILPKYASPPSTDTEDKADEVTPVAGRPPAPRPRRPATRGGSKARSRRR